MMNRILFKTGIAAPLLCILVLATSGAVSAESRAGTTQGFRDEINRPPEPYRGPPRSGEQVYDYRCKACHARATQGAPMPGDEIDWGQRAKQGMKTLMQHVKNGYKNGLMPPRGGCRNCSDSELRAAVIYMLEKSHVKIEAKEP